MMQRRNFLAVTASVGVAAATFSSSSSTLSAAESLVSIVPTDRRADAKLRLSSQLRGWIPGKSNVEKMEQLKKWGFEAVEPHVGILNGDPQEYKKQADDAGLKISVICGSSTGGKLCSADENERQQGIDEMKRALETAAMFQCNGAILAPVFNKDQQRIARTNLEIRQALIDIDPNSREIKGGVLKSLGDFAADLKVNIIIEPLNRKESWFLRNIADAASICRDCQSDGIKTMGDFYHMFYEEPDDMGAFISGGKYVKHVHFGCGNKRVMPGQDPAQSFVAGFRGLKFIGYQEFMSFECGCLGGDAKGAEEVPKVLDYIKKCWDEA